MAAKNGDTVKIHYTGTAEDGTVIDSTRESEPATIKIGEGKLMDGIEDAMVGMEVGDKKTVAVPCDKAFGPHKLEQIVEIDKSQLPPDVEPKVGTLLDGHDEKGAVTTVLVVSVTGDKVVVDGNHPLAGRDLTFEIELMEIVQGSN